MPYVLRKAPKRDLYWVVNKDTKQKHSKDPLPKARAEAQMRALYAQEKKGGSDCGCGKGSDCHTRTGGAKVDYKPMLLELSQLGGSAMMKAMGVELPHDAKAMYLAKSYHSTYPTNKRVGAGLHRHMMNWMEKELEKMDCGCGCKGMKKLAELSGGKLTGCREGYSEHGLLCVQNCSPNERDDGTACWGKGLWSEGDWRKRMDEPGHQVWHHDDALLHHYKDTYGRVDWQGTAEEFDQGMKDFFSDNGPLAKAFDPEKNGVGSAFRQFGRDTNAAFKDIGEKMANAFDPNKNGVREAFEKVGQVLKDTLGNEQWWRDTMSNPDTYIMLVGMIASAAATVLSAGTLGPAAFIALQALGPAMKIIGDAAQGRPVDALDIAGLALSMVPLPGAGAAAKAASDAIIKGAAFGTKAAKALPYIQRMAQLGKFVVKGVKLAQSAKFIPPTCIKNCPPPDRAPNFSVCEVKQNKYLQGYDDKDIGWTTECPKPPCDSELWNMESQKCDPADDSPDGLCLAKRKQWGNYDPVTKAPDFWGTCPKPECEQVDMDGDTGECMTAEVDLGMGGTDEDAGADAECGTEEKFAVPEELQGNMGEFPDVYDYNKKHNGNYAPLMFQHKPPADSQRHNGWANEEWQLKLYTKCDCALLNTDVSPEKQGEWEPITETEDLVQLGSCGEFSKKYGRSYDAWYDEIQTKHQADFEADAANAEAEQISQQHQEEAEKHGFDSWEEYAKNQDEKDEESQREYDAWIRANSAEGQAEQAEQDRRQYEEEHRDEIAAQVQATQEANKQRGTQWLAEFQTLAYAPKTEKEWESFGHYLAYANSKDEGDVGHGLEEAKAFASSLAPPQNSIEKWKSWMNLPRNSEWKVEAAPVKTFSQEEYAAQHQETPEVVTPPPETVPEGPTDEEQFQAKYGIGFDAAHAQEGEYEPGSDFIQDLRRSGGKKVGGSKQMSRQMGLSESQRPGKHHIQALQVRRIARQTVKILPAQHRPCLLREQSQAATIGTSGMGMPRRGGYMLPGETVGTNGNVSVPKRLYSPKGMATAAALEYIAKSDNPLLKPANEGAAEILAAQRGEEAFALENYNTQRRLAGLNPVDSSGHEVDPSGKRRDGKGYARRGGDLPRRVDSGWYYPTDTNFEAGAQSSGNAGSGYSAHF